MADAILDHADDRGVDYADPESIDPVTGKDVRATVESPARGGGDAHVA